MGLRDVLARRIAVIEWLLGLLVISLAVIAWLSSRQLSSLTIYDIFPPLGLMAFGLMWTYYVIGALRRYAGIKGFRNDRYMALSSGIILALIILHPGLLWLGLYSDGYGLPPASYLNVYASQVGFVLLGTTGLVIFLAYELRRFFAGKRWWKYIEQLQLVGMVVIFVHAIGLGRELKLDWFMILWWFYGIGLAVSVIYSTLIHKPKEDKRGKE